MIVQPSAKREGFATIPDVTWEDVGALKDVREELTMAILVHFVYSYLKYCSVNARCAAQSGVGGGGVVGVVGWGISAGL